MKKNLNFILILVIITCATIEGSHLFHRRLEGESITLKFTKAFNLISLIQNGNLILIMQKIQLNFQLIQLIPYRFYIKDNKLMLLVLLKVLLYLTVF